MTPAAVQMLEMARIAFAQGKGQSARQAINKVVASSGADAGVLARAASLALSHGEANLAVELYGRACELEPDAINLSLDHAIALSGAGYHRDALTILRNVERMAHGDPRYWSIRGNAARLAGEMIEAARSYETCLSLDPHHPRGLQGRAHVALAQGEDTAVSHFDRALSVNPGIPELWLGKAQALEAEGRYAEAGQLAMELARQAPHWTQILSFLTGIKRNLGETDDLAHFAAACRQAPDNSALPLEHINQLVLQERYLEAAERAGKAREDFPHDSLFALLEAGNLGMAGEIDAADACFARLTVDSPDRWLIEGRHRIRKGDLANAEQMLLRATKAHRLANSAYALLGIVWRLTGDQKAWWLHGQEGLVRALPLAASTSLLDEVTPLLNTLHDRSHVPLGQSVRGGTQTRHVLFHRCDPALQQLKSCIEETLETYRHGLPPRDPAHPLLQYRDMPWHIAGSWSVRLHGGGDHHAAHIHPQGILSSALYFVLPDTADGSGHLELGRPPRDLMLDLEPLQTISPRVGNLCLFPSTLFHGTTLFETGTRMTVAFDVLPVLRHGHG